MTQSESLSETEIAASRRTSASHRRRLAVCVGVIGVMAIATWLLTRPTGINLPPTRQASAVRVEHPLGYSMVFPAEWRVRFNKNQSGASGPISAVSTKPAIPGTIPSQMLLLPNFSAENGVWGTATRQRTSFQGKPADKYVGEYSVVGLSFIENLKFAYRSRAFVWSRKGVITFWAITFERHGRDFCLFCCVPGRASHGDRNTIPPEIMSYFETFKYTPPEPSNVKQ